MMFWDPDGKHWLAVEEGQTLTSIAKNENVSLQWLILANNIENPDLIRAGSRLWIPEVKEEGDFVEMVEESVSSDGTMMHLYISELFVDGQYQFIKNSSAMNFSDAHFMDEYTDSWQHMNGRLIRSLSDSLNRMKYNQGIGKMSRILKEAAKNQNNTSQKARLAYDLRNRLLDQTRSRLTREGRALSELLKDKPMPYEKLIDRRIDKFIKAHGRQPTAAEIENAIIGSAGRSNIMVTRIAKASIVGGVVLLTYQVYDGVSSTVNAPEGYKTQVASYNLGRFGGGMLGGVLVGAGAGALIGLYTTNPGAIFAGALLGGIIGGYLGEEAVIVVLDEMWGLK